MTKRIVFGLIAIAVFSSCVKSLESAGVMKWDLSALDLPQMEYNGKTYYIHPDAGEMTYEQAIDYCKSLNAYNHQDWFLPDKQELLEMFAKASSIGGFQEAAYWFENPYSENDTDRHIIMGSAVFSTKARVRPVRCESSFFPTLSIRQVIPQNWTTYAIEIPKGSRYSVSKAGIARMKNGASVKSIIAPGIEGVINVSVNELFTYRDEDHHFAAFAEMSSGETVYSGEIIAQPHSASADLTIAQTSSTSVHVGIDISDWGFPQQFNAPLTIEIGERDWWANAFAQPMASINIPIDEFNLHYECDFLNINLDKEVSLRVSIQYTGIAVKNYTPAPKTPSVQTLPATDITTYTPYLSCIQATLNARITDCGVPCFNEFGFVFSYTKSTPTVNDHVIQNNSWDYSYSDYSYKAFYSFDEGPFYYRAYVKNTQGIAYGDAVYVSGE